MSIVTLKKKTAAQYHNNSCNLPQFALNGTRRSQGYVGQDMRGRTLPKTIMKGAVPKGHGGCCGKYPIKPIVQSAVTSLNNPAVVKKSVVGTYGLLETKYRWIRRPQPYSVTKPGDSYTQDAFTQQVYITNVAKATLYAASKPACQPPRPPPYVCTSQLFRTDANPEISNETAECVKITKDISDTTSTAKHRVATTQGQYIQKLDGACGAFDKTFPLSVKGAPVLGHC